MTPLEFIASLPHGEAKAAALTVHNLMSPKATNWTTIADNPASYPPPGTWVLARRKTRRYQAMWGVVCFLQKENKRLVSELESRPVVWMLRSKYTGLLEMSGDHPDIYCLAHAKQFNPNSYSLEPYAPT